MRIVKLILENFIGLYAGSSELSRIEIDFPQDKLFYILCGKNGSGKTTILSRLQPLGADPTDKRKNFIIPGKEGYEELHIIKDEDYYILQMVYGKKNKFFIQKNEEELNPNGGVTTYNELVEKELGFTNKFFKISHIGNNVTNFIDLGTRERKNFINNFIPNTDKYVPPYKIIKDKLAAANKRIKFVANELGKYGEEDDILVEINANNTSLKVVEKNIADLNKKIGKTESIIDQYNKDGIKGKNKYEDQLDEALSKNNQNERDLKNLLSINTPLKGKSLVEILEMINENNVSVGIEENVIRTLKEKVTDTITKISILKTEIKNEEAALNKFSNEAEIESLKTIKANCEKDLQDLQNQKDDEALKLINENATISDVNNSIGILKKFSEVMKELLSLDEILLKIAKKSLTDINSDYKDLQSTIASSKLILKGLESKLTSLKANEQQLEILSKRPDNCTIDSCAFISNALRYKDIANQILEKEKEINKVKTYIENDFEVQLANYNTVITALKNVLNFFKSVDTTVVTNTLNIDIVKYLSKETYHSMLELPKSKAIKLLDVTDNDKLLDAIVVREGIKKGTENLNTTSDKIAIYENNSELIKRYRESIFSKKNDLLMLEESKQNTEQEVVDHEKKLTNRKARLVILEKVSSCLINQDKLKKDITEATDLYNEYEEKAIKLREKLTELETLKSTERIYTDDKKRITSVLNDLNVKLSRLREYKKEKDDLDNNLKNYTLIEESLNPATGIPLLFIKDYLNSTRDIANELLDMAYGGSFMIKDFVVTDDEFFIRIVKDNGSVLEDVTLGSQGEVALTKISISLAIIRQIMESASNDEKCVWNIICLDEIDGGLDANNRKAFIEMIDSQISSLGIEQVFVISHNQNFDAYPSGMILLRDHGIPVDDEDYMVNKEILFNIDELE